MSLSDLLTRRSADKIPPLKGEWRQFVLDHLTYIAQRSATLDISPEIMNLYRYDLNRFLKDRMGRRQNIGQIVLLINDLDNDFDFHKPGKYLVPEDRVIESLYASYLTITETQF